jgi:hypothetical protein
MFKTQSKCVQRNMTKRWNLEPIFHRTVNEFKGSKLAALFIVTVLTNAMNVICRQACLTLYAK